MTKLKPEVIKRGFTLANDRLDSGRICSECGDFIPFTTLTHDCIEGIVNHYKKQAIRDMALYLVRKEDMKLDMALDKYLRIQNIDPTDILSEYHELKLSSLLDSKPPTPYERIVTVDEAKKIRAADQQREESEK